MKQRQESDDADPIDSAKQSQRMFTELSQLPVPTVCLLNGSALGGGV